MRTNLTVTGQASATTNRDVATLLAQGTKDYATYVTTQVGYLVHFQRGIADCAAGNGSRRRAGRVHEGASVLREDRAGRGVVHGRQGQTSTPTSTPAPTTYRPRSGRASTASSRACSRPRASAGSRPYGAGLVTNVKKLQSLTTGLTYKPFELANGAQELLDEVARSKITGEEERYSHIDLLDFQGNDEGAEQAFASLQPGLEKIDPALTKSISTAFAALDTARRLLPHVDEPVRLRAVHTLTDRRQAEVGRRGEGGTGAAVEGGRQSGQQLGRSDVIGRAAGAVNG